VPMGQQTTIAYMAPDSSSMMGWSVQKADGTCVGSNCSTYLTDWTDGSGGSSDWASNITPSLNSQMKAGQHWTMTIQNAGEGYNGYLFSPSGQGLPAANGSTPAGAQFKYMTPNEIKLQPPWATALEEIVGEVIVITALTIATAGAVDVPVITGITADALVEETVTVTVLVPDVIDETLDEMLEEDITVDEESVLTDIFDNPSVLGSFEGSIEAEDPEWEYKLVNNDNFAKRLAKQNFHGMFKGFV